MQTCVEALLPPHPVDVLARGEAAHDLGQSVVFPFRRLLVLILPDAAGDLPQVGDECVDGLRTTSFDLEPQVAVLIELRPQQGGVDRSDSVLDVARCGKDLVEEFADEVAGTLMQQIAETHLMVGQSVGFDLVEDRQIVLPVIDLRGQLRADRRPSSLELDGQSRHHLSGIAGRGLSPILLRLQSL